MRKTLILPLRLFVLTIMLAGASSAYGAVTITIQNADSAGVGFNDTTAATPVGGNTGTTVGQQRLIAFQRAAQIWGSTLNSSIAIVISARWSALTCTATTGVLGSAGAVSYSVNFIGAPVANTWYSVSLANALSGSDLNTVTAEINAQFNVNLGTPGCLPNSPWYYGLDANEGNGTDLVAVLLHEFGHGLGFQTRTSGSTGEMVSNFPTIYDRFLRDNTTGKMWPDMTNAERQASAINNGNLVWTGPQVTANVPTVLGPTPSLRVNSPAPVARKYEIGLAAFGPNLSNPGVTNTVAQASPANGCTAIGGSVSGRIAFIDRGGCDFVVKVKNAQNAGALAVIIGNVVDSNLPNQPPAMGGTDATIVIPTVSVAFNDAEALRAQLGSSINATIFLDPSALAGADSSNRVKIFAPNPIQSGSSIAHFDVSAFPNLLMEPSINDDLTHSVTTPNDLSFALLRDIGWTGSVSAPTIQLTSGSFTLSEGGTKFSISVNRTGDTSATATVDYATGDNAGTNGCETLIGQASSRCDYGPALGKLTFAPGETSKTVTILLVDDSYAEGNENLTLTLSNPTGATLGSTSAATLTITDNEGSNGVNPINDATFFVRQHYLDFLNREPDTSGLNFWTNEITSCNGNAQCIEQKRINVSAAFFLSIEFQQTGFFVERMYRAAYGQAQSQSTFPTQHSVLVPIIQLNEFLADKQQIGDGVVVGQPGWEALLESKKVQFANDFVARSRFTTEFPGSLTAAQFVDKLNTNAGNPLSTGERNNLVNQLQSTALTRAQVVRAVVEDSDYVTAETNSAFVLTQFFGYLRRNPNSQPDSDHTGFDFWLGKLNLFNGNFVNAEMVKAFIISDEYRRRFGP